MSPNPAQPEPRAPSPEPPFRDPRLTEQRNPRTERIDVASSLEIVDLINAEDATVAQAVQRERERIARAIDLTVAAFRRGGRLVYVGAGSSGRLGLLDASEAPPTFGVRPDMVLGLIAGGYQALLKSQEGAEDDVTAGTGAINDARVTADDMVIGIAASGTTPYVRAALSRAQALGATTGLVSCSDPPRVLLETCDVVIVPLVGPEVLTGSTRMKAGTATKLVLNTISTGAMIRLGRAYGNLMVDLMAWSDKLRDRGERIVMEVCEVDRARARAAIDAAGGTVKLAIVMVKGGLDREEAVRRLDAAGGLVRPVVGDPPPVTRARRSGGGTAP
jgi:N-acetylmuramic acid 6-phosphate etherase